MSTNREELHHLIDELPGDLAAEVLDFARYVQDRRRRDALIPAGLRNAPLDDEPTSMEEAADAAWARADYTANGGIRLDALMADRQETND